MDREKNFQLELSGLAMQEKIAKACAKLMRRDRLIVENVEKVSFRILYCAYSMALKSEIDMLETRVITETKIMDGMKKLIVEELSNGG